jgi:hypothetical protein
MFDWMPKVFYNVMCTAQRRSGATVARRMSICTTQHWPKFKLDYFLDDISVITSLVVIMLKSET